MTPQGDVPDFVAVELAQLGVTLDARKLALLARYLDLLLETNKQFNLTAVRDRDAAWRRLVIDSLTLLPLLDAPTPEPPKPGPESLPGARGRGTDAPSARAIIDVGSGAGLPGIPLAIALPAARVCLLEATTKKAKFLQACAAELPLPNVKVINARAETLGQDRAYRQQYDIAVCRAVGPMTELLEYTLPLIKVGGRLLAMKGPKAEAELEAAADALAVLGAGELRVYEAYPESFGQNTVSIEIVKDRPTPAPYPRAPGTPRTAPL